MRVKVHLHGYFKEFHDGPIEVNAGTIAQAVTLATRMIDSFRPNAVHGRHRVRVVGCDHVDELYQMVSDGQDIHLVPQFSGGKKGGFLQIILGAVLVAAGFFLGMPLLMKVGALIFLGGVSQMLSPTPDSDAEQNKETQKSRYLGAPKNTVEIGTRIPILYGEAQVYGHFLSFDVDSARI